MKKLISYTLIASILSVSLMGCSSESKTPEVFGQKVDKKYYSMEHDGYKLIDTHNDYYKRFEKRSLNGEVITVTTYKDDSTSIIDKTSDLYPDYQSCLISFNVDNKNIQKIITDGEKQNIVDSNNAYVQYGKKRFQFKNTPCDVVKTENNQSVKYQYNIHMEGLSAVQKSEALQSFKNVGGEILIVPVAIVAFIIMVPVVLITWATLKMMGYKGG